MCSYIVSSVAIGSSGGSRDLNPIPVPVFKYPMINEIICISLSHVSETKLFHFRRIFQKNEIKISKANPHTNPFSRNPGNPPLGEPPSSYKLRVGHHRPISETPFQWCFAGGPMMAPCDGAR